MMITRQCQTMRPQIRPLLPRQGQTASGSDSNNDGDTNSSENNAENVESSDKASIAESGSDSNNDGDTDSSNDDNDAV